MPNVTELPLPVLQVILRHLEGGIPQSHHFLRHTTSFLPDRHPGVNLSLDGVKDANAVLPACLLAPALACPVLAAACASYLGSRVSYLTYYNTGGCVMSWLAAFAPWVRAVCAGFVLEDRDKGLGKGLGKGWRGVRVEKVCRDTAELLRQISLRSVRLRVLDLVSVPFDGCEGMEDELMAALCGTLEASSRTLKELALPIYPTSDMCALALETVTLPHLSVLSIELRDTPSASKLTFSRSERTRRAFLRMMQAADGHADRSCGLTTLQELRLFYMYHVPCSKKSTSGCSPGFFRAVRTLRVHMSDAIREVTFRDLEYLSLFENLECLYSTLVPGTWLKKFKVLKRLKELHFCYHHWIKRVQVGPDVCESLKLLYGTYVMDGVRMSKKKIVTLMTYDDLDAYDLMDMAEGCPNLRYLSFLVTNANIYRLRELIEKCTQITGLEMITNEEEHGELGNVGWEMLGKAIPRRHANLREIAIQPRGLHTSVPARVDKVTGCLLDVVKRLGPRANRLVFRALVDCRNRARMMNATSQILDACALYSRLLTYLEVNIFPRKMSRRDFHSLFDLPKAISKLKASSDMLKNCQPNLRKLDLGWHHWYLFYLDDCHSISEDRETFADSEDAEYMEDSQDAESIEYTSEESV